MNLIKLALRSAITPWQRPSLFGSVGSGALPIPITTDFIPLDSHGNVMYTRDGNVNPHWLGLSNQMMQYWSYKFVAPLASVIDRIAEADTNGKLEFLYEDDTTIKNINKIPALSRIKALFKKPNPTQTWEEFNSQQVILSKIFGYCPVLAICPAGMDKSHTSSLWNLHPLIVKPEMQDVNLYDRPLKSIIKRWKYVWGGREYYFDNEDIILVKDGFIDAHEGTFLPKSKLEGLDFYVSNICASLEADNVLLKKKGPLGVFTHDPKPDVAGWEPMKPEMKQALQDDLSQYGLSWGQMQYVISKNPVRWEPMSFNLRDLMTKETARQGVDTICDRFGYPAELMSGKNATYENRSSAERYFYQNNIIPFSLRRMSSYNNFFGLTEHKMILDYDHVSVLQEDILKSGQAMKSQADGLDVLWKSGLITFNQVQIELGNDTVEGMDIYYGEWLKTYGKEIVKMAIGVKNNTTNNDKPASKDTAAKE